MCVYVCGCMHVCMWGAHEHLWAHVCVCVWRSEVNVRSLPKLLPTLSFEVGSFNRPGVSWFSWTSWPVRSRDVCLSLPHSTGSRDVLCHVQLLWGCCWSKLLSWYLHYKHFTSQIISPTQIKGFLKISVLFYLFISVLPESSYVNQKVSEPCSMYWELNSSPLNEQQVPLTSKPHL